MNGPRRFRLQQCCQKQIPANLSVFRACYPDKKIANGFSFNKTNGISIWTKWRFWVIIKHLFWLWTKWHPRKIGRFSENRQKSGSFDKISSDNTDHCFNYDLELEDFNRDLRRQEKTALIWRPVNLWWQEIFTDEIFNVLDSRTVITL